MSKPTQLPSFCPEEISLKCAIRRKFPNVIFNDVYYIDSVQVNKMEKKSIMKTKLKINQCSVLSSCYTAPFQFIYNIYSIVDKL